MIAHAVGLNVVAEGVETQKQLEQLVNMGCEEAQGYLFSRPVPEQDVPALLRSRIVRPAGTGGSSII
jgi:EAL domain-containing protein (putative c-di-GMP-specific phosphodiesterase class I)